MQDGVGTLREPLCKSDTAILILTQTHTPTRASEDSKRSSRTSNTSEIKPSFRGWDHQVISLQVNLEKQCPPPPTPHQWSSSSGCDKAEGSAAFCVWRSSQESCDKHTSTRTHAHTHFSWWKFRCCSEHPRLAALYLGTQRRGIVTTELQNFNVPHVCALCHSPSSSSRLAPPPVLTWLTLSSVFHFAQQVAVSPPPGHKHIRPLFKGQIHIPLE